MEIKSVEQASKLEVNSKLYIPGIDRINSYCFVGINPRCKKSIILISTNSVNIILNYYFGFNIQNNKLFTNYEEACLQLLKNAEENISIIKEIYLKKHD